MTTCFILHTVCVKFFPRREKTSSPEKKKKFKTRQTTKFTKSFDHNSQIASGRYLNYNVIVR